MPLNGPIFYERRTALAWEKGSEVASLYTEKNIGARPVAEEAHSAEPYFQLPDVQTPQNLPFIPPPFYSISYMIEIDSVGVLSKARKGHRYVLVAVGYLSRNVEVQAALFSQHAINFPKEKHKLREKLNSDKGTSFYQQTVAIVSPINRGSPSLFCH